MMLIDTARNLVCHRKQCAELHLHFDYQQQRSETDSDGHEDGSANHQRRSDGRTKRQQEEHHRNARGKEQMKELSMFVGLLLLIGAAGTDDYYTMQGLYHSINYVQIIIGLILMGWPVLASRCGR